MSSNQVKEVTEQSRKLIDNALIEAYYYLNQYKSASAGEPKYWEWKRQQTMTNCLRAFQENGIDWRQQHPEDR